MNIAALDTPIGRLGLVEKNGQIVRLLWRAGDEGGRTAVLEEGLRQLSEYFDGSRTQFDLPLAPKGSPFQQSVFDAMQAIPKGSTRTYGEIANDLGVAAQPVGQACGANPIPVIIPCHRVLAKHGIGGFSAGEGVELKIRLLKLEGGFPYLI